MKLIFIVTIIICKSLKLKQILKSDNVIDQKLNNIEMRSDLSNLLSKYINGNSRFMEINRKSKDDYDDYVRHEQDKSYKDYKNEEPQNIESNIYIQNGMVIDKNIEQTIVQQQKDVYKQSHLDVSKIVEKQERNYLREPLQNEQYVSNDMQTEMDDRSIDEMVQIVKEGWLKIDPSFAVDRHPMVRDFNKYKYEVDGQFYQINHKYFDMKGIPNEESFYFRLSGLNLYYTSHPQDLVVMGALSVVNMIDLDGNRHSGEFCFMVSNHEKDDWELCAKDQKDKYEWMCAIYKVMGKECPQQQIIEEREIVKQPVMILLQNTPNCNQNWNYYSQGDDWECECQNGHQSPIDLPIKEICSANTQFKIQNISAVFRFKEIDYSYIQLQFRHNLIQITASPLCKNEFEQKCNKVIFMSVIDTDFQVYDVSEVLIHAVSDHTINSEQFDMEIQAVGYQQDDLGMDSRLILSWLGKVKPGSNSDLFKYVDLLNLPDRIDPIKQFKGGYQQNNDKFNLKILFDNEGQIDDNYFDYYSYKGSLSQPPCSSNTKWIVFMDTFNLGLTVVEMFKNSQVVEYSQNNPNDQVMYYDSYRKIQRLEDRVVDIYIDKQKKELQQDIKGHFEKVEVETDKYFYQPGSLPSGFKGAQKVEMNYMYSKVNKDKDQKS